MRLIPVSVFAGNALVGNSAHPEFFTNGGAPAIQNGSVAGVCPFCGEIWLRALHADGFDYWRFVTVPCTQHAGRTGLHAFTWGTIDFILPPVAYHDTALLAFEWNWWDARGDIERAINGGITTPLIPLSPYQLSLGEFLS